LPLMPGAIETVVALRKAGYSVGIVSDGYQLVAETVRKRVFADFSFAHLMIFRNGKASGRLKMCPAMTHPNGCSRHEHCKANVLQHLVERFEFCPSRILAVGDRDNDICLLRRAGWSVAFRGKSRDVQRAAKFQTKTLEEIVSLAGVFSAGDLLEPGHAAGYHQSQTFSN
jgi:glucosyl-3-phosphoglycerate synthase